MCEISIEKNNSILMGCCQEYNVAACPESVVNLYGVSIL